MIQLKQKINLLREKESLPIIIIEISNDSVAEIISKTSKRFKEICIILSDRKDSRILYYIIERKRFSTINKIRTGKKIQYHELNLIVVKRFKETY